MSFNYNSNNKAGDASKLTSLQQLSYKPIDKELKNTLYPDFPAVNNAKDIIQLLLMHVFEPKKTEDLCREKSLVLEYNEIMDFLQADDIIDHDGFDTFFIFVCCKDIDENLFKDVPYLVRKKPQHNYRLIGLPKNSYFSINAKQKVLLHGVFMLKYNSKDKKINKNAVYLNIRKNVEGYITK
ncbi:uncharacterized protein HGUI_02412 [Hanseniaspora guilliermondii]|uniref:Uncharacterized protein n=1 Tax=Hanseniaspora guilliermondii TaxID=56406 RepID=A0A1L0B335_9ASCO|nr:uncharacterized protein HGUI_02412 [Hanseniaspora guilliermondii]